MSELYGVDKCVYKRIEFSEQKPAFQFNYQDDNFLEDTYYYISFHGGDTSLRFS